MQALTYMASRFALVIVVATNLALGSNTVDLQSDSSQVELTGIDAGDRTGARSDACDINGDGIDDLVVGADFAAGPGNSRSFAGEVYVFFGERRAWAGSESIANRADTVIYGQEGGDYLGRRAACADVDNDGFGDLILGASGADGPMETRTQAGQLHIVFGSATLPASIDLSLSPGTVIYGELAEGRLGQAHAAGDLNGDGFSDIAIDAKEATDSGGSTAFSGRVYLLFGRSSWPAEMDLASDSDVRIVGASTADRLGEHIGIGDFDRDGSDDLFLGAARGDGPGDSRTNAGDIHVFYGRASWPIEIDLQQDSADQLFFGADSADQAGGAQGLVIGDVDGDDSSEVWVDVRLGNGPSNNRLTAGEIRLIEYEPSEPTTVDLSLDTDHEIFGSTTVDQFGVQVVSASVDADGISDLIASALTADGPSDSRSDCGETAVFLGGPGFPTSFDLASSSPDFLVYGELADDQFGVTAAGDINGDGFADLIGASAVEHGFRTPAVWIVSSLDSDGDGVGQLADNCPLVANAAQLDSDGDRRGDLCAFDWDGDGQMDQEDCNPQVATAGTPAPITDLVCAFDSKTELNWSATSFSEFYDVVRGDISSLAFEDYGDCQNDLDSNLLDTIFDDPEVPVPGFGFSYLIRGRNTGCVIPGPYGHSSFGEPRFPEPQLDCE